MSQRDTLKKIVKFGKREYNEKKPLTLKILRVKSKSVITRGMLPSLNIKQIKGTFFITVLDYGDYFRIYSFNKAGQLLGGENVDKNPKFMKTLLKSTTMVYHLPKEKRELTIDDITSYYNEEFNKILNRMNSLFGFNIKKPYSIIAHQDLKLRMGRMIGCAKSKDKEKLVISPELYKKDELEIVLTREIMYLYLKDLIVMFQDIIEERVYWYDLAILFTNFYLRNEKNDYLRNVMEKSTLSFLNFEDGAQFFFSEKIIEIFKKNRKIYETKEINTLFTNVFGCLKILKEYKIRLRYKEFSNLFFELCELFMMGSSLDFFQPCKKIEFYRFHYRHFQKTSAMDRESKKSSFLYLTFSLLSNNISELNSLNNLIKKINQFKEDEIVRKEILNYEKLVDIAITEYIFNNVIEIIYTNKIDEKFLEISIEITNNSEYTFQNFKYDLSWKPKNRLTQSSIEEKTKSIDLHANLKRNYLFAIQNKGKISILLSVSFLNPLNFEKNLKKILKLEKIDLGSN